MEVFTKENSQDMEFKSKITKFTKEFKKPKELRLNKEDSIKLEDNKHLIVAQENRSDDYSFFVNQI